MKTLKISDKVHMKLTRQLGKLTAQTMKIQILTYQNAIEAFPSRKVIVPPELLQEVEDFLIKNKHNGYTRDEDFINYATCLFSKWKSEQYEYFETPEERYEKLRRAIEESNMPYMSPWNFLEDQKNKAIKQYETLWKKKQRGA